MKRSAILKYLQGKTTEKERLEMLRWIEEDPAHLEEYKYLRRIFNATVCREEQIALSRPSSGSRKIRTGIMAAAAAAVFILLSGVTWTYVKNLSREQSSLLATSDVHVPVGQRSEITLNDGTRIWLNSNSTLHIDNSDSKGLRRVSLKGEAYFEVAHNERLPFVVQTGSREVKVLGTKFSVSAYNDGKDYSVRLYEGAVEVNDSQNNSSLRLYPAEEARLSPDGQLFKTGFDDDESLLWIEGIYYFENTDYVTILRKLQEYYKTGFDIRNPEILKYRCTCKFRQEDGLQHILDVLQKIHRFEYEWSDDRQTVIIR